MRRRDHARRGAQQRATRGALFSPFVSQTGLVRRRMPGLRLAFSLLFLLVVGGGCVGVVAAANHTASSGPGRASSRPAAPSPEPLLQHSPHRTRDPGARAPAGPGNSSLSIDRVLAYTPFVRTGIPRQRVIALTFDDGPSPYTPQIVSVLARMHAPATFFIVGQQLRYFAAGLRDEVRHGFVIGDHTENHPPLIALTPSLQYFQIHAGAVAMTRLGAPFPRLFRPPYGVFDRATFTILGRLDMLMVLWSVDPRDWLRPGAGAIVRRVLAAARPGAIVELHDGGGNRSETVAALPAIITALRRRHYRLVTVPQLLSADPPPRHQPLPHLSE